MGDKKDDLLKELLKSDGSLSPELFNVSPTTPVYVDPEAKKVKAKSILPTHLTSELNEAICREVARRYENITIIMQIFSRVTGLVGKDLIMFSKYVAGRGVDPEKLYEQAEDGDSIIERIPESASIEMDQLYGNFSQLNMEDQDPFIVAFGCT
jgi:hypothetical protein